MNFNPITNTTSFTCVTCNVVFKDGEIQRNHYKSDWHRYNLKRKIADLPAITAEAFLQKENNQKNLENAKNEANKYCNVCKKSFANQNAYDNHSNSRKHKDNEKNYEIPTIKNNTPNNIKNKDKDLEIEEIDSDEWEEDTENPIDKNNCIFCNHPSRNFIKNMEHMTNVHSFFIPDIEYCTDVQGLLRYLGEKITEGFMCLWCNDKGKTFHSVESVQKHMLDKGHCKMLHEGLALAEYTDYYDYSSSYPDAGDNVDPNEEIEPPTIDGSDYELVLPSGAVIGHRSLMRYYKQHINKNRAVVPSKNTKKLHKVLAHYRALGWTETQQELVARKARDIHYMKRLQSKHTMKLGMQGNKLQRHYRPQVNF